jgi:hypothetical protein
LIEWRERRPCLATCARIVAEETGSYLEAPGHQKGATTRAFARRITVTADKHGKEAAGRIKVAI